MIHANGNKLLSDSQDSRDANGVEDRQGPPSLAVGIVSYSSDLRVPGVLFYFFVFELVPRFS